MSLRWRSTRPWFAGKWFSCPVSIRATFDSVVIVLRVVSVLALVSAGVAVVGSLHQVVSVYSVWRRFALDGLADQSRLVPLSIVTTSDVVIFLWAPVTLKTGVVHFAVVVSASHTPATEFTNRWRRAGDNGAAESRATPASVISAGDDVVLLFAIVAFVA